jgi:hypothetical protein
VCPPELHPKLLRSSLAAGLREVRPRLQKRSGGCGKDATHQARIAHTITKVRIGGREVIIHDRIQ